MLTTGYVVGLIHLLTLALGMGSVTGRAIALRKVKSADDLAPVYAADNLYGIASLIWIATGLWRAFGGIEKGTDFYLSSTAFWIKMGLFGAVFALEILPMVTLIRWRIRAARGQPPELSKVPLLYSLTVAEIPLLVLIVAAAAALADGY
jgi:putative membrane protein